MTEVEEIDLKELEEDERKNWKNIGFKKLYLIYSDDNIKLFENRLDRETRVIVKVFQKYAYVITQVKK